MQHINDDIDELFRNAADNYPLKINGADWESVAGRLEDKPEVTPVAAPRSGNLNKNYKYLLLLLLVPVAFLIGKYVGKTGAENTAGKTNSTKAQTVIQQKQAAPLNNNEGTGVEGNNVVAPGSTQNATTTADKSVVTGNRLTAGSAAIKQVAIGSIKPVTASQNASHLIKLSDLKVAGREPQNQAILNGGDNTQPAQTTVVNNNPGAGLVAKTNPDDGNGDVLVKPGAGKEQTPANTQPVANKENAGPEVQAPKLKRFYIGAFIAPDYTTVKYQPGNKIGFDYGGMIGYNISKTLSVEFGISTDKKYYTTDGKYYNSKQDWITNAGKLLTLSGYSSLTEFPLNLKYSFKPGKDGNFFVAGGLTSYVVHEENYDYEFDKSGYIYHKVKSSKVSTTNMFANINLSAGYESRLSSTLNFRVEPYYRVPIKGIGLGSLPITSIGLNIGVTKKIK